VPFIVGIGIVIVLSTIHLFSISEKTIGGRNIDIDFKHKKFGLSKLILIVGSIVGFLLLFTVWRSIGIIIILSEVIGLLITWSLYKKMMEKYTHTITQA